MRLWMQLAYLGGSLAIGVFNAFNVFTVSVWLGAAGASLLLIALIANTRTFAGAIVSPIAGSISDRVWLGWLGRRRPFILGGGVVAALILALTPSISRLPTPSWLGWLPNDIGPLAMAVLAIFLYTVAFNLQDDIHKALLADIAHGPLRNRLSSWSVVTDMGGQVLVLVLGFFLASGGIPDLAFHTAAALILLGIGITVVGVREPSPSAWRGMSATVARPKRVTFRALWRGYRPAFLFVLSILAYWTGVNVVLPLLSVFTIRILGASEGEALLLPALMLLSTTLCAIPVGLLANKYGKKPVMLGGFVVLAIAAVLGTVITTREQGALLFLLAGVGNAASMVLMVPLLADLVPRDRIGSATGLLAGATSITAPLSALMAGIAAEAFGPRATFVLMTIATLIAIGLLTLVRAPRYEPGEEPSTMRAATSAVGATAPMSRD